MYKISFAVLIFLIFSASGYAQTKAKIETVQPNNPAVKSSPAFAELLLKKTEVQSELESLILEYTEDYPKVSELRQTLVLIQKESDRLTAVKPADSGKLTLALGKLMVRKAELETELWSLLKTYKDEHPDVKRAKRRVEIYEAAIKEILG